MARPRLQRLSIRFARSEKSTLKAAAALRHETVSEMIRGLALAAARQEIRQAGRVADEEVCAGTVADEIRDDDERESRGAEALR